jgi:predicted alpha/beta superfamily hydrolase
MRAAICFFLLLTGSDSLAQDTTGPVTLPRSEQRVLRSEVVGVSYKLYVSLPRSYASSDATYPVIYLLDADYSFAIARNVVEHLSDRGDLPEAILVGIGYDGPSGPEEYRANRSRDYTPSYVANGGYGPKYQAVSGGGPSFREFISNELVPFVEANFRASRDRYLVGHSYGGLFSTWVALTTHALFRGYVIVSPSLWYDDGAIFETEQHVRVCEGGITFGGRMYLTVGSREINSSHNMVADLRQLAGALESGSYPDLAVKWEVAADETHNSVFPRALSNGLRFVLKGR